VFTPIELDKPRRLRFDIQACVDMESALGMSLGEIVHRLRTVSITTTRGALWAGLKHEDPTMSLADAQQILQTYCDGGGELVTVSKAIDEALSNSTPLKSSKAGNARPKAATAKAS
jgi:hypothetical protein